MPLWLSHYPVAHASKCQNLGLLCEGYLGLSTAYIGPDVPPRNALLIWLHIFYTISQTGCCSPLRPVHHQFLASALLYQYPGSISHSATIELIDDSQRNVPTHTNGLDLSPPSPMNTVTPLQSATTPFPLPMSPHSRCNSQQTASSSATAHGVPTTGLELPSPAFPINQSVDRNAL